MGKKVNLNIQGTWLILPLRMAAIKLGKLGRLLKNYIKGIRFRA